MHNKSIFALAGVFLAVALIVPVVILVLQSDTDLQTIIVIQNPYGLSTGANNTSNINGALPPAPAEIQQQHQTNLIIIAVVEAIFLSLFVVTIYSGINHVHPGHGRPEKTVESESAPTL
jgi:hypothetical protein